MRNHHDVDLLQFAEMEVICSCGGALHQAGEENDFFGCRLQTPYAPIQQTQLALEVLHHLPPCVALCCPYEQDFCAQSLVVLELTVTLGL